MILFVRHAFLSSLLSAVSLSALPGCSNDVTDTPRTAATVSPSELRSAPEIIVDGDRQRVLLADLFVSKMPCLTSASPTAACSEEPSITAVMRVLESPSGSAVNSNSITSVWLIQGQTVWIASAVERLQDETIVRGGPNEMANAPIDVVVRLEKDGKMLRKSGVSVGTVY